MATSFSAKVDLYRQNLTFPGESFCGHCCWESHFFSSVGNVRSNLGNVYLQGIRHGIILLFEFPVFIKIWLWEQSFHSNFSICLLTQTKSKKCELPIAILNQRKRRGVLIKFSLLTSHISMFCFPFLLSKNALNSL